MPRPPRYLAPAALPPVPDPATGLPRPPHAPGHASARPAKADRRRVSDPAKAPDSPLGQGPVLAWYATTRRYAVQLGVGAFLAAFLLLWLREGFRVSWMRYWEAWAGLVVIGFLVALTQLRGSERCCAAGVEWLSGPKGWVRIYELAKVTSLLSLGGPSISMQDKAGRRLSMPLATLQEDRVLWDLVYNGILHSVIAGNAETNGAVHLHLHLPYRSTSSR
jgi:hypothetical protein